MTDIDITTFFTTADPFDFSHSIAEGGQNAGKETWAAAVAEGTSTPLLTTPDQLEAMREWVNDFGAWSAEEIAAWTDAEVNALFIQFVSGDIREAFPERGARGDATGGLDNEPDDSNWKKYEKRAEDGQCSGNIYRADDGTIYFSLCR